MKLSHPALAACLFAFPVTMATTFSTPAFAAVTVSELGDLSAMRVIVADTQALVAANDLAGAKAKITEYETAWDNAAGDLRGKNAQKWDAIDAASDVVIEGLRADAPAATSDSALTALLAQLDNPGAADAAGVATTDTSGKPLPCEDMLAKYRAVQPKAASLDDATKAKVAELEAKGLERCNADDDKRADDFFSQAIQLIGS
ncbi:hypothetical protein ABIB57_005380 [Devosia sp. UYZn731]|uniref:hypothetical protein n=1 Tax=Devosia sp. UYZn731 TaxID=3156345 RepID=UPI003397E3E8